MSLLNYKSKKLPSAIKKQMVEEAVDRVMERYEKNIESTKPLSVEESPGDPVNTMEVDTKTNVPEELKNPEEHGGEVEVLVSRLRDLREE